jgi:hypothetical protein
MNGSVKALVHIRFENDAQSGAQGRVGVGCCAWVVHSPVNFMQNSMCPKQDNQHG